MTQTEKLDKRKRIRTHTKTWDLLKRHTLEEVRQVHWKFGIYESAKKLDCDPSIVRYLALREGWKRPLPPHLLKAYREGRWNSFKTNYKPNSNNNE
jgi:hypothetical protein